MGSFTVPFVVHGSRPGQSVSFSGVVDTGATYSLAPADILEKLGLAPIETVEFVLADDRSAVYGVADVSITLEGRTRVVPLVFGPPGSYPLIGAVTLETFHLAVDPVGQRLFPVPAYLL